MNPRELDQVLADIWAPPKTVPMGTVTTESQARDAADRLLAEAASAERLAQLCRAAAARHLLTGAAASLEEVLRILATLPPDARTAFDTSR